MRLTRDQKVAFAAFLECEKQRHMEDISMINEKLAILGVQGIKADEAAPWVEESDLWAPDVEELETRIPEECIEYLCGEGHRLRCDCDCNKSPFGGYWRYQLDKAFENSTGEDNDGFAGDD